MSLDSLPIEIKVRQSIKIKSINQIPVPHRVARVADGQERTAPRQRALVQYRAEFAVVGAHRFAADVRP